MATTCCAGSIHLYLLVLAWTLLVPVCLTFVLDRPTRQPADAPHLSRLLRHRHHQTPQDIGVGKDEGAISTTKLAKHTRQKNEQSYSLYVHIPYCRRRCSYCDFAIVPIGTNLSTDRGKSGFDVMDNTYRRALLREIDSIRMNEKIELLSIYFGGGTPSLAPLETLQEVMDALINGDDSPFVLKSDGECTIEMDPGTFDLSYLQSIKQIGFNRISLGVQSFDDSLLEIMGRVHRAKDVYSTVEMIRQVFGGDANYSIDLISGTPGLSLATWAETLSEATRLQPRPKHMSVYDLQVEEGTAFWKRYGDRRDNEVKQLNAVDCDSTPTLPSADECAFMYSYASGYLRSKTYEHYEISSYAYSSDSEIMSYRSQHNSNYWGYRSSWFAIGLGATSRVNGVRIERPRALSDYCQWAEQLCSPKDSEPTTWMASENDRNDDSDDELLDLVMTRMRTSDGLDIDFVADKFGQKCADNILSGFQLALDLNLGTTITSEQNKLGSIRLNDPDGFLFSNNIISNVFLELEEGS